MHALTTQEIRAYYPSVLTRTAYHKMSDRYKVASTGDVIDILQSLDMFPVRVKESKTREEEKRGYVKHMVRFRKSQHLDAARGTEVPEMVLVNSFDGSSAYKLNLGIFRVQCENGLVCPIGDLGGYSVKHSGKDFEQRIIDVTAQVVDQTPKVIDSIGTFKQIALTAPERSALATAALEIIDPVNPIKPEQLLRPRRREDTTGDLWTTFNVIQENALKGGVQSHTPKGKTIRTRPVNSVDRDIKLNKALWTLTEQMAKIMGA